MEAEMTGFLLGVKILPLSEACGFIQATIDQNGTHIQVYFDRGGISNPDMWENCLGQTVLIGDCVDFPEGHELAPGKFATELKILHPADESQKLARLQMA